jgi:hypothetical protein
MHVVETSPFKLLGELTLHFVLEACGIGVSVKYMSLPIVFVCIPLIPCVTHTRIALNYGFNEHLVTGFYAHSPVLLIEKLQDGQRKFYSQ